MLIQGEPHRSIEPSEGRDFVTIIDQTELPYRVVMKKLADVDEVAEAIFAMRVRGAPLIGASAAFGFALALREDTSDEAASNAAARLLATRPTAVNLHNAIERMTAALRGAPVGDRFEVAWCEACRITEEDVAVNQRIGEFGLDALRGIAAAFPEPRPLRVLTHCNAGWLATVDWGTALSPIFKGHEAGLDLHVWVDETRPRSQGGLTAFELREQGINHTLIVDNAGGHLMQRGLVDVVIVGSDRTTASGDVCNKIGTYEKALAAHDNGVPFWVALPSSTIDWGISDGVGEIPIEERSHDEIRRTRGRDVEGGHIAEIELYPAESPCLNPAFDVTPSRLVTKLLTEFGPCEPNSVSLAAIQGRRLEGFGL